jgi:hypothetical protein
MIFKPINFKKSENLNSFCDVWAEQYSDKNRDMELYYPAINSETLNEALLLGFYEWKNGSVLSQLKKTAFVDKIQNKLAKINELKKAKATDFKIIRDSFPNVSDIWLITLAHLINPDCFPIFDQHVYRAYKYLKITNTDITEYDKENKRTKLYLELYLPFFDELIASDKTIDKKKIDEALWSFGKFLSSYSHILR